MILEQIVADSQRELAERKRQIPLVILKKSAAEQTPAKDFGTALRGGIRLIAEVKKASPSRGVICPDFNPVEIAGAYASGGAAAISVLTETKYFQGRLNYLRDIRHDLGSRTPPLLRKDFIYDSYQVYESRAYGADALLLIAAILTPETLVELLGLSHELGMSCLIEVHNENELLTALDSGAGIIGINNRDLKTFKVDLAVTERLCPLVPSNRIIVSESGIRSRSDIVRLQQRGVNAFLVGEALMSASNIAVKIKELL